MPERQSRGFSGEKEEERAMARRAGTSKKETFKVFIDFSSVLMRKKLRPAVPLYLIV
jgi:hypothetical protein